MILNPFALASVFVGILSLLLVGGAGFSALYFYRQMKVSEAADERAHAESRLHLSLLLLITAFLLRLATWPLFYILLQSLIPEVPGAMCIYGVTQVMPAFISFMQTLKPLAFFLIGGWLLFYGIDLSLGNHPLMDQSVRMLVAAAAFAAVDGIAELSFVFLFSAPGVAVSCCTVVADIVMPAAPLIPIPLFGAHYHAALMAAHHGFNLGLPLISGFLSWKKNINHQWLALVAFGALLNCAIAYAAFKESLGPRLMHLPDHHCLYCLLQYRPVSILILALFVLGSFLAIWPFWLSRLVDVDEGKERLALLNPSLLKYAAACLATSWLLTILMR